MLEMAKNYTSSSSDSETTRRGSGVFLTIMGPKISTNNATDSATRSRRRSIFGNTFFNDTPQQHEVFGMGILQTTEIDIHSETASQISQPYGQHPHNQPWFR